MTTIRKITRPADFAAAAADLIGFEPTDSFVVVSATPGRPHVRIDHPHSNESLLAAAMELGAAYRAYPGPVCLLAFTDNRTHAYDVVTAVTAILDGLCEVHHALQFIEHGEVTEVIDVPSGDVVDHLTRAMRETAAVRRIAEGSRPPAATRADRAWELFNPEPQPAPDNFEASAEILHAATEDPDLMADEMQWTIETVRIHALTGLRMDDADAARVMVNVTDPTLSEAALAQVDRTNAPGHVAMWTDLVQRAPEKYRAVPALLLAFGFWLSGDGAAAWMAYDHADAPEHPFAKLVHHVNASAVSPSTWTGR